jgi:hypothetical protein
VTNMSSDLVFLSRKPGQFISTHYMFYVFFIASTSYPPTSTTSLEHYIHDVVDHYMESRCCNVGSVERVELLFWQGI